MPKLLNKLFMNEKRTYKQYPQEFKAEAMSLVSEQSYRVQKSVDLLCIRSNKLYRWKEQLEDRKSGKALSESERVELKKLRKENKDLRMEKEVSKKASAYWKNVRFVHQWVM